MLFKAAVLVKKNKIKLINLRKPKLKPYQVFVKMIFSSMCHTQLQEINGLRGYDKFLPHCLGHEGIGKVVDLHNTVKKVKVGDTVCLSWIEGSGNNSGGTIYNDVNGKKINAGPVHTFNEYAAISENKIYKVNNSYLKSKVLLGCALSTAYNALEKDFNKKSKSICIIGSGGLGLSCVVVAKKIGYKKIIVIDKINKKLKVAKKFGATNTFKFINQTLQKNKIDVVVECTGNINMLKKSINIAKKFGGKVIVIGNYKNKQMIRLNPWDIILGTTLMGAWNDNKSFDKKFKKLEKTIKNNQLEHFFSDRVYKLNNILDAIKDFKKGTVIRPLINMQ